MRRHHPGPAQRQHQDRGQHDVREHRDHRGAHRRTGVLAGVEGRQQHLAEHEGRHADAHGDDGDRDHGGVVGGEFAVLEQGRAQRRGHQRQAQRGRDADQGHQAQAPVQRMRITRGVGGRMAPRQMRQDHRADGDAEQAQRKLHQPVGVIQPGLGIADQHGREHRAHQQVQLRHRGREDRRQHQPEHPAHALVAEVDLQARPQPQPPQGRPQQRPLRQAGQEHAPGQRVFGHFEVPGQPQHRGDHRQVVQHRGEGRQAETADAVEDGASQGRHRDEGQVGEGDAQHVGRQRHLLGVLAGEQQEQPGDPGRKQHAQAGDHRHRRQQGAGDVVQEVLQRRPVAALVQLRQHRHEGRRERTLGEDAPQVVRDAIGHHEGADRRPGAEQGRLQQVPGQAGDPGQEGHGAEHRRGPQQAAPAHAPTSADARGN